MKKPSGVSGTDEGFGEGLSEWRCLGMSGFVVVEVVDELHVVVDLADKAVHVAADVTWDVIGE